MRIALGPFACSGIEAQMGPDVAAGVRKALFHYAGKLKVGRAPIAMPRFLRDRPSPEPGVVFDLSVGEETEHLLEQEATRQGATLSELANHSVMVYLAELDFVSGGSLHQAGARSGRSNP